MKFSKLVELKSWERTQDQEIELGGRIGGPEGASDARKRWPREFIKAAKARKAIPLDVLVDRATKSVITLAAEDGTFTHEDLEYLRELARELQAQGQGKNPTAIPLYLWAMASFLSFLSSLISIFKSGKIPLVVDGTAANPKKARSKLRDRGREGTLLTASFITSRREGQTQLARAIQERAKTLFPRTWKAVLTQLGDPDDPETGNLVVAEAEAVIEAASVDELRTILPSVINEGSTQWWPVWEPVSGRYPWRLADIDGNLLRRSREGRLRRAYLFETAQKALAFLKTSKGRKAVATQEYA